MNCTKLTMHLGRLLMLAFLVTAVTSTAAYGQDDQEYKHAFNEGKAALDAKNYDEAYTHLERSMNLAQEAGDEEVVKMTSNVLSKIDYSRGNNALKKDEAETALTHFEIGIEHDATYAKNYYGKGLALKNLERIDDAMAAFKEAMETNDRTVARAAESAVRDYYGFLASSALSRNGERANSNDADEALAHIATMREMVELDADAHYYLAEAHKLKSSLGDCISEADQAIEMSRGSRTDKAKMYYVKGECLMRQGDNSAARAAFENALYGNYKAPAQHFIETLGGTN
jgi:tetratricopeptide (TPR) repeat protein